MMIPISQMLIAKGMAVGPVMVLMISSAGASLPEYHDKTLSLERI
jgi:uncharacterized membrane protein YraQ (UPF0718 family)